MGGGRPSSTSEQKISSLVVQTSAQGLPIPLGWGTARVKCNLIWYNAFRAIPHVEKQSGGKGMPVATNTTYTYTASTILAICEGGPTGIAGIRTVYRDKELLTLSSAGLTLFSGAPAQAGWGYLLTMFPTQYSNYSGTAYVAAQDYALTRGASLQNHSFEVQFASRVTGKDDANPRFVVEDVVGSPIYGVSGWPGASIAHLDSYENYCLAAGLLLSPTMDSQRATNDFLSEIAKATNSEIFMSEGLLKVVPYGDTEITGNGVTWTPDLTPQYDLTDDDFETPPHKSIEDQTDAYNIIQVEYLDRANQYNNAIQPAQDLATIRRYGRRRQDPISLHCICDAGVAVTAAQLILQKTLYRRDRFKFTLPSCYDLLEPTDYVTLTTTTDELRLNRQLVQLEKIVESDDDKLDCTAVLVPVGSASAAHYTSHSGQGTAIDTGVAPGSVTSPVLMVAPADMTGFDAQIWLAAASTSDTWGGCEVHISTDGGVTYRQIGKISEPARYGTLTATLASHADPDSVNTMRVNLTNSGGTLVGVSAAEMNAGGTLCWVDGEVMAYQNATLTAAHQYDLTPLRRGLHGSSPASHASGSSFVRLDEAIFRFDYDELNVGGTVYVKLPSFNIFGQALEDISAVTAYTISLPTAESRYIQAMDEIEAIASDSVLSHGSEKQQAIIDWASLSSDYNALVAKYISLGSPAYLLTPYNDMVTARNALSSYLTGLSPAWNNTNLDTPIVSATWISTWGTAYDKISAFQAAALAQPGLSNAIVEIYQRAAAAPTLPSTTSTYTFATGVVTGMNNGWTATIPSGMDPLWVALATASATTPTDTIASGEWTTPQILAQNGSGAFTLVDASGGNTQIVSPVSVQKLSSAAWDGRAYALEGSSSTTVSARPRFLQSSMVALTTDPTNGTSYTQLDYALFPAADTSISIYRNGATAGALGVTWTLGDTFSIVPMGDMIHYYKNGQELISPGVCPHAQNTAGETLYATFELYDMGATLDQIAVSTAGTAGINGLTVASVEIYQRAPSSPTIPSATATFTFATGALTGLNNGWSASIPAGTDPIWTSTATAAATAPATSDTIPSSEWATPQILAQNGSTGAAGLNVAKVEIYQRSATTPSVPSTTATFTFATGGITGLNNGWSAAIPAGTDPIWITAATAAATTSTDTIGTAEWATPQIMAQNGAAGAPAANSASVLLFQRTTTSTPPSVPSTTSTYTFNPAGITGMNNGWTAALPTSGGKYRWWISATAVSTGPTDTIGTGEWSTPAILAEDGTNGVDALTISADPGLGVSVPCTSAGTPKAAIPTVQLTVYQAASNVTGTASYAVTGSTNVSSPAVSSGGAVTISGMGSGASGTVTLSISSGGATSIVTVTYTKVLDGANFVDQVASIGAPSGTTLQTTASFTLLMGPNGTINLDANGSFTAASGTRTITGNLDYSLNGSSWTTATALTVNPSVAGADGDYTGSATLSGATIGLSTKQDVYFRVQMRQTASYSFTNFDGTLHADWSG